MTSTAEQAVQRCHAAPHWAQRGAASGQVFRVRVRVNIVQVSGVVNFLVIVLIVSGIMEHLENVCLGCRNTVSHSDRYSTPDPLDTTGPTSLCAIPPPWLIVKGPTGSEG